MTEQALPLKRNLDIATIVEKILYRLGLRTPPRLDRAVAAFVAVNSKHWPAARVEQERGRVLIEGHLAEYGPNYSFRTAVAAKALQETRAWDIDVVFNSYGSRWSSAKRVYRSFGIGNFIFLGGVRHLAGNAWRRIASFLAAARIMRTLAKPEDIVELRYGGVKVGDLIYDDTLKMSGLKTIARIDRNVAAALRRSYYYYLQYRAVFRRRRYRCYVATHTTYSEYGILCRVALACGVPVIETTDIQMSYHEGMSDDRLPTYHDGIRRAIVQELADPQADSPALYAAAEEALQKRLASQVRQLDTDRAFRGRVYTRPELCSALQIAPDAKIGFVLAHIFADSPHISCRMLYADYFQWLTRTFEICRRAADVTWVVKPHPSCDFHHEQGMVEKMVAALDAPNVKLCPPDLNTRSLESCADAVVTVHGTAGIEFACVGVPVILAGQPFFASFGFTIEPATIPDYERTLLGLRAIEPLSETQRRRAIQIFGVWERQFDWHNPIVTSEVLANVWGNERPRNLEAAYEVMTRNVSSEDPRRLRLWRFAQSVVNVA